MSKLRSAAMILVGSLTAIVGFLAPATAAADAGETLPDQATFSRDVAPILYANCVVCHRPGQIGPMSLTTYEEVRPWTKSIRQMVADRVMPPWHADPDYGKFSNERRLSDRDVAVIARWIDQGAPRGNPSDLPPAPVFGDEWQLGQPDLVLTFDELKVPGGGPDQFHFLVSDVAMPEDRWVQAVEIVPGNRKVVHHVIAWLSRDGSAQPSQEGWLGAWAAGTPPMVFREGTGRFLRQGTRIIADMHIHPTEEPTTDRTRIGLHFAERELAKELINLWVANTSFEIPAGAESHEVRSTYTFQQDSHIINLIPHMHYRGKDFTYTAVWPDGRREVLLRVPRWDFNWQTVYELAEPLAAPKGTRIECVAHFDNSANNPANPDPTKNVTFGNESYDEMMIGFIDYIVDEGVRPRSSQEIMVERLAELQAAHAQDVYKVHQAGDASGGYMAVYFPRQGDGVWFIPVQGQVLVGRIFEQTWLGEAFSAKVETQGLGTVMIRGVRSPQSGGMKGKITMMNQTLLEFEGTLAP